MQVLERMRRVYFRPRSLAMMTMMANLVFHHLSLTMSSSSSLWVQTDDDAQSCVQKDEAMTPYCYSSEEDCHDSYPMKNFDLCQEEKTPEYYFQV